MRLVWVVSVVPVVSVVWLASLGCLAGACGSSQHRSKTPQPSVKLSSLTGDVAAIEKLFDRELVNGGLWFDDAGCARDFRVAGAVPFELKPRFAQCLAGLPLAASSRKSSLPDVEMLAYAPGFELQARIVDGKLRWIGFASRRDGDTLPTISPETLESLRIAGEPHGPIETSVASKLGDAMAWIRVCVDATGAVGSTRVHEASSFEALAAFSSAIRTWKFRPFVVGEQPVPACAVVRLVHGSPKLQEVVPFPPPQATDGRERVVVQPVALEPYRVSGNKLVVPDDVDKVKLSRFLAVRIQGTFVLCLDDNGQPESVAPLVSTGLAGYDRKIVETMKKWRYKPIVVDGVPTAVCATVTFIYTQRN